jgi:hypothetical protein
MSDVKQITMVIMDYRIKQMALCSKTANLVEVSWMALGRFMVSIQ